MKNFSKLVGIIALAALIVVGMAGCSDGGGGDDPGYKRFYNEYDEHFSGNAAALGDNKTLYNGTAWAAGLGSVLVFQEMEDSKNPGSIPFYSFVFENYIEVGSYECIKINFKDELNWAGGVVFTDEYDYWKDEISNDNTLDLVFHSSYKKIYGFAIKYTADKVLSMTDIATVTIK